MSFSWVGRNTGLRIIGDAGLLHGWKNVDNTTDKQFSVVRVGDLVMVEGLFDPSAKTGAAIYNLPTGFHPLKRTILPLSPGATYVQVTNSGSVQVWGSPTGNVSVSGCFYTEDDWPETLPGQSV